METPFNEDVGLLLYQLLKKNSTVTYRVHRKNAGLEGDE